MSVTTMWKKLLICLISFGAYLPILAQETVRESSPSDSIETTLETIISPLTAFVEQNPKCWSKEIIYDGTSVLLCSDGEAMLFQLRIQHPVLLMRMLMQGYTLFIDPTGKKKEKYAVIIPSARDVQEMMMEFQPQQPEDDFDEGNFGEDQRPDIRPLLMALTEYGATLDIKGKRTPLSKGTFALQIDEEHGVLIYSVLVPLEQMLTEKKLAENWRIGLYSSAGRIESGGPEFEEGPGMEGTPGGRFQQGSSGKSPMPQGNDEKLHKLLKKDIETWIPFIFTTICSLN